MIGAVAFARMKPGAILINTSRGGVVDQQALVAALRSGRLSGAGLDVQNPEPPAKDNPLFSLDNVVLTPHYASTTVEALAQLCEKVNRQVVQFLRWEWPTYLANPKVREQPNCRLTADGRRNADARRADGGAASLAREGDAGQDACAGGDQRERDRLAQHHERQRHGHDRLGELRESDRARSRRTRAPSTTRRSPRSRPSPRDSPRRSIRPA